MKAHRFVFGAMLAVLDAFAAHTVSTAANHVIIAHIVADDLGGGDLGSFGHPETKP